MTRRRPLLALRIAAWAAVGVCLVVFARKLDWDHVIRAFKGADLRYALAAALIGVPGAALQGLRWSSLVKGVRRVPRSIPVAALYVGQAASVFLPMRAGEAVRTELLARATGIGRARALGTVALDHSVNGVVMFTFAAFLPALLPRSALAGRGGLGRHGRRHRAGDRAALARQAPGICAERPDRARPGPREVRADGRERPEG